MKENKQVQAMRQTTGTDSLARSASTKRADGVGDRTTAAAGDCGGRDGEDSAGDEDVSLDMFNVWGGGCSVEGDITVPISPECTVFPCALILASSSSSWEADSSHFGMNSYGEPDVLRWPDSEFHPP